MNDDDVTPTKKEPRPGYRIMRVSKREPTAGSRKPVPRTCHLCGREIIGPDVVAVMKQWRSGPERRTGKPFRTRTVAYSCRPCLELDPDFTRPPLVPFTGLGDAKE